MWFIIFTLNQTKNVISISVIYILDDYHLEIKILRSQVGINIMFHGYAHTYLLHMPPHNLTFPIMMSHIRLNHISK